MAEINLLKSLPKGKRNITARESEKSEKNVEIAREYGRLYFDGPRAYGYGGYHYDGRWQPVAKDIAEHFKLATGDKVLDIGCAKGFLVKDLVSIGIDAYGVDISQYAIECCESEISDRVKVGSADNLAYPDNYFDAVICINTIHNLKRDSCLNALREIERLAPGKGFVQVDSFKTLEQKKIFESWVLTAQFYDYPEGWLKLFKEAGYSGDYYWTIIE